MAKKKAKKANAKISATTYSCNCGKAKWVIFVAGLIAIIGEFSIADGYYLPFIGGLVAALTALTLK